MRRLILASLLLLLNVTIAPTKSAAQSSLPATLVADQVQVDANGTLIAQGNVEVFYNGSHLKAQHIIYSRQNGSLKIEGPITLVEGDNNVILADSAELSGDLKNGILRGARMVVDQQLQLAAAEIHRVDGRYVQLYKTVASSCSVCADNPVPLWQIRAQRVIHDQQARQLYFDNAVLRVAGVPILYIPRLRLPDPTLDRATGFLVPSLKTTSKLGVGLKTPYFITLGKHADITMTPYIATKTKTMELSFRRAFATGDISFQSAYSKDDVRPNANRSYFFGEGRFDLPRDYVLNFDLETTSDRDYLLDYSYSDKDRLDSAIGISRARRDKLVGAQITHYHSLRFADSNDTQPSRVTNMILHRRFVPALLQGDASYRFETHSHFRQSTTAGDDGRDVFRASLRLDWKRGWTLGNGMIASAMSELNGDFYEIKQGLPNEESGAHFTPAIGAELRWPLIRTTPTGASQILEPVAQIIWSDETAADVPNEDSRLVEFDEGNLFSLTRFSGVDKYERGLRANLGLNWTHYDPDGWSLGTTLGRVFHRRDLGQFPVGTGLAGLASDWLSTVQLKLLNNFTLTNRALFDDEFSIAKDQINIHWQNSKLNLATGYLWVEAAPSENRPNDTSEWIFDSSFQLNQNWETSLDWRYDFIAGKAASAQIGMIYRNECVKLDLSLSRRFTSSGSLTPTTDFNLSVALTGFGNGSGRRVAAKTCRSRN